MGTGIRDRKPLFRRMEGTSLGYVANSSGERATLGKLMEGKDWLEPSPVARVRLKAIRSHSNSLGGYLRQLDSDTAYGTTSANPASEPSVNPSLRLPEWKSRRSKATPSVVCRVDPADAPVAFSAWR
jgi:hypothetical protein